MPDLTLYVILIVVGFIIQSLLPSPFRQTFDILAGGIGGFCIGQYFLFLPSFVCLGVLLRMLITGHIGCSSMMVISFILGLVVGIF